MRVGDGPRHVAVIPDGNRRWARQRGLEGPDGHRAGIKVIGDIARAAWAAGVDCFTFWWGSPANLLKRTDEEVRVICESVNDWLCSAGADMLREHDARFEVHGRWRELCPAIAPGIDAANAAAGSGPRTLCLLIAYDGREEILAAAEGLDAPVAVDEFSQRLWTRTLPPVDLLIRTGGEPHLSAGFMLWRIAEAQLAFVDELWPAFTPSQLDELLARYASTERRFGR